MPTIEFDSSPYRTTPQEAEEHRREREELLRLMPALDVSESQLRRDECGAWNIFGQFAHISVMSQSYHLVCFTDECDLDLKKFQRHSARRWESAKRRLSFATVVQDGDAEGILDFTDLPSPEQAAEIRDILGLRKKREISDAERERLSSMGFKRQDGPR
jgi:hypothetical protein